MLLVSVLALAFGKQTELYPYDPVADVRATVTQGNARFTVLTPRLIRMEYSSSAKFEDRATIAIVNRKLDVPTFTQSVTGGVLSIATKSIELTYTVGQSFNSNSLTVKSVDSKSAFKSWRFGQLDQGNLFGTIRTLDREDVLTLNCSEIPKDDIQSCEWGLVSRDGWALVDDTKNYALDADSYWVGPNTNQQDYYLFAHGHDYTGALMDYTLVGGKVAMFPRYANGIMWSRWYDVSNTDTKKIVADYETRQLPLDVYILDMNWHTKQSWTGYSFDRHLFPYPEDTLGWLHHKGLHTSANLHDAAGVNTWEEQHPAMAKTLGLDPTKNIPLSFVNRSYAYALEDVVLGALEDMGMDFWWIDWQQGEDKGGCAGGKQNPTIWTNKLRGTDHIRRGKTNTRGLVLGRWGGLGNHRYQVGFSGDVAHVSWEDMAYQPYFSMTASNVLFGFWSHDIVGIPSDPEMHTRWIQLSALSGTFRTHERGESAGDCADRNPADCWVVEPWNVATKYYEINRAAMIAREELIPYIYTQGTRRAFDTGVGILRPMYYAYPESDMAYKADPKGNFPQYMFGDDLLVSPVVTPLNRDNQMAQQNIWLPAGRWYEHNTGVFYDVNSDSQVIQRWIDMSEIPIYVRAGAIIPIIPVTGRDDRASTIGLARKQYTTLGLSVYPGTSSGQTLIYEDDGATTAYLQGRLAWTTVSYIRPSASTVSLTASTTGTYPELPNQRQFIVKFRSSFPASTVLVNGKAVPFSRNGDAAGTWSYDGETLSVIVRTGFVATNTRLQVNVTTIKPYDDATFSGLRGIVTRSIISKANLNEARKVVGESNTNGGKLQTLSSTSDTLAYLANPVTANAFLDLFNSIRSAHVAAMNEIKTITASGEIPNDLKKRVAYSYTLLSSVLP
jgi:alpha-glucosidase (family GH31 glycosyl hydrolase)